MNTSPMVCVYVSVPSSGVRRSSSVLCSLVQFNLLGPKLS